jgi:tetratricopeptide (TPR) repeat protein
MPPPPAAPPHIAPFWPYDWQALEERLDIETIEKQGEYWLYRGLNIKRLIAFIGSGVSMAYGRVTWNEIATLHIDRICEFGKDEKATLTDVRGVSELIKYVQDVKSEPDSLDSEKLYTALQACEQVWRLIAASGNAPLLKRISQKFDLDLARQHSKFTLERVEAAERGSRLFRHWIKRETYDELPHVKRLLDGWTPEAAKARTVETARKSVPPTKDGPHAWLEAIIPAAIIAEFESSTGLDARERLLAGLREVGAERELLRRSAGDHRHSYPVFFHRDFLTAVAEAAAAPSPKGAFPAITKVLGALAADLATGMGANEGLLRPVRRFALGLVLDLTRLAGVLGTTSAAPESEAKASNNDASETTTIETGSGMAQGSNRDSSAIGGTRGANTSNKQKPGRIERASLIAVEHDPLRRLTYDLGISRYLTTNYDLEVERLFADMGFEIPADTTVDGADIDEVEAIGPSGGRTRDLVLTERSAIDLVDFAANDSAHEFQVVHLHGRATEHHDIVVTEADYQRTYVSGKSSQQAFRQGLEVAFGGNPILFVGLGLSEGDVLRPLREFMTDRSRDNRAIIALRDGREPALKRETFAKRAYAQYGVHVLHYGFESTEPGTSDRGAHEWLAKVSDAVRKSIADLRTLRNALNEYAKAETSGPRSDAAVKAAQKVEQFTANPTTSINGRDKGGRFAAIARSSSFLSDGAPCDVVFETKILQHIDSLVASLAELVWHAVCDAAQPSEAKVDRARIIADFLDHALRPAIERAEGAIITAALNAKLEAIKAGWLNWWKNWRLEPKTRTDVVHYERLDQQPDTDATSDAERQHREKAVWARHFAYDPTLAGGATAPDPREPKHGLKNFLDAVPELKNDFRARRVFMLLGSQGAGKGSIYNSFALRGNDLLPRSIEYTGQFFTTFSFSIEIASVWDALVAFLHDPNKNPNLFGSNAKSDRTRLGLRNVSRVDALRRTLHKLPSRLGLGSDERLLVVLNAFDVLLDENGEPKNSEIRRILHLLLGPESRPAPLDIVCICRDRRIHGLYVEATAGARAPSAIPGGETSPFVGPAFELGPVLHDKKLTLLLSTMQRDFGEAPSSGDERGRAHSDFLSSLRSMQGFVRLDEAAVARRPWLAGELGLDLESSSDVTDYVHILDLSDPLDFDWPANEEDQTRARKRLLSCAHKALQEVGRNPDDERTALQRLFRVHLQRRRFLYTLIVAAAAIVDDEARLIAFLRNLIPTLRGPGASVQDRVIEAVLDFWFDRPKTRFPNEDTPDPVLWEELLRHLAVITTPVTVDVLALCPKIARHVDGPEIVNLADPDQLGQRIKTIKAALDSLSSRGLVFSLQPAGSRRSSTSGEPRYVVHRAIQRYVYRKLGSQRLDPSESNTFTLSLYAAQQRNYPRLNAASYAFVYNLVHTLSAFPAGHHYTHRSHNEASRMLRAALGVARNLLSVGVVTRFSDFDEPNIGKPAMSGHLQHHWAIVRWLLTYAQDLERGSDYAAMSTEKREEPDNWLPFYRDELVWLANECGVLCYSQGQTYDAAALYWLASRFQRNVELLRPGAHRSRLFLNDAWCSIDRARLDDAEGMLREVYETLDEEKILRLVARGGLALVSNIRGRTDLALTEYDYTIGEMQKMQRSRPLSILLRHRGDLRRHLRDRDEAEKDFVRAIETAETSGYLDLVHTTQVARVRNLLEMQVRNPYRLTEALDAAHAYAERMNIPRLLCEVLMVRAELLLKQGQSDVAGQFANRATRIATLNGLTLRKIAYLELLARVERAQGNTTSAQRLLARTVRFARHVGYNLMIERVERERNELVRAND